MQGGHGLTSSAPSAGALERAHQDGPWALDIALSTHFPIGVGFDAQVEVPGRILLRGHIGWMPSPYADVINGIATGLGFYKDRLGTLIKAGLDQALIVRVGAGWRPFEDYGFEAAIGYTLLSGGKTLTASAVATALNRDLGITTDVGIASTLHGFHIDLSWRWVLFEHLLIRAGIGYVHTLSAQTRIDLESARPDVVKTIQTRVDDILSKNGISLELKLSAGYRF